MLKMQEILPNKPKKVILHCTDSDDAQDWIDVNEIDKWHKARGWRGVGYHWIICRDGNIQVGRLENEMGAHTFGQNRDSIGVCWVGSKLPSEAQIESLFTIFRRAKKKYDIGWDKWFGHYEFDDKKTCPNINMKIFRDQLRDL
jgi:N-acetylmuramoyl-L-alanine amidase